MILLSSRPILRRVFKGRLTLGYCGKAPRWRPMIWHNPNWTIVRVGSRRHYLAYRSALAYRRVCRRVAQNSIARRASSA